MKKKSKLYRHKNYIIKKNKNFNVIKATKNYINKKNQIFNVIKATKNYILKKFKNLSS